MTQKHEKAVYRLSGPINWWLCEMTRNTHGANVQVDQNVNRSMPWIAKGEALPWGWGEAGAGDGGTEGRVPVPLFPWNISAFSLVLQNQNLNFLCSRLPKIAFVPYSLHIFLLLFPCSPEINVIIPLFPITLGKPQRRTAIRTPMQQNPWSKWADIPLHHYVNNILHNISSYLLIPHKFSDIAKFMTKLSSFSSRFVAEMSRLL